MSRNERRKDGSVTAELLMGIEDFLDNWQLYRQPFFLTDYLLNAKAR